MAIPITKYINIVSGVGGNVAVAVRDLITRIYSSSLRIDPFSILEFTDLPSVGKFFGLTSPEYLRASFYFGWVSPAITSPRKISFSRIVLQAVGAAVFGGGDAKSIEALILVTVGRINLVIDGVPLLVSGISLAGSASLAAVATAVQTALIASDNVALTNVSVTYDATRQSFVLQCPAAGAGQSITVVPDTTGGTDLGTLLEWTTGTGAVATSASSVTTPLQAYTASVNISNNFGSFVMPDVAVLADVLAVAQANQANNVQYEYEVSVTPQNAITWATSLADIGGIALTVESPVGTLAAEYPEMCPGIILAATQYDKRKSAPNNMYKQFALTPSVTDGDVAAAYDTARVNYYGRTQVNGQMIDFYQDGVLLGLPVSPSDQNVWGNEAWLKSDISAGFMSLMLSLTQIPADDEGAGLVKAVIQATVDKGLFNGVILQQKTLNLTQQLFITQQTGSVLAWQQVAGISYWFDVQITSYVDGGVTKYQAEYVLIYSKADSIRRITGSHELI